MTAETQRERDHDRGSPSQNVAGCAAPLSEVRCVHRIDEIDCDHSASVEIAILADIPFVACMTLKPRAEVLADFVRLFITWIDSYALSHIKILHTIYVARSAEPDISQKNRRRDNGRTLQ